MRRPIRATSAHAGPAKPRSWSEVRRSRLVACAAVGSVMPPRRLAMTLRATVASLS